jgi:CRISPR-associated protein (TIGR03984 family)
MKIDYEKIRAAFPGAAWAYAEGFDSVKIGRWNGNAFTLAEPLEEDLSELRVFDDKRELKFTGGKCRDTADYDPDGFIPELAGARYFMYGEQAEERADGFTALSEKRGGALLFPSKLEFPKTDKLPKGTVGLKLGIRNYVRYNPVPVLPKGEEAYDFGLGRGDAGAIEAVDYAYTGFFYTDGKAVEL